MIIMRLSEDSMYEISHVASNQLFQIKDNLDSLCIRGSGNIVTVEKPVKSIAIEGNNNYIRAVNAAGSGICITRLNITGHSNFAKHLHCGQVNVKGNNNTFFLNSCERFSYSGSNNQMVDTSKHIRGTTPKRKERSPHDFSHVQSCPLAILKGDSFVDDEELVDNSEDEVVSFDEVVPFDGDDYFAADLSLDHAITISDEFVPSAYSGREDVVGVEEESKTEEVKTYLYVKRREEEKCSICFEEFREGEVVGLLNCCHKFHNYCLNIWLKAHAICPLCRFRVKNDPMRVSYSDYESMLNITLVEQTLT
eukprot:TRINITY_DN8015_c0_g1_i4.p1 TRINITY_DN8015_c0_g1~~TRINITY_DN8015_c0_g1_i4.p1  ORF type:complete len:308 (+),score=44.43 TRINITY_DN8015_c0_g1_i4:131-1054(+)